MKILIKNGKVWNASQIYNELCDDKNFPMGTVFDWREM